MYMKIIVCDDDPASLDQINSLLLAYGKEKEMRMAIHTYLSAAQVQEVFAAGELKNTDLILLDIMMKDKNGIELAEEIRSKNKDVPIVFVTSSTEFALKAYHVQAVRYLLKPLNKEAIYEMLDFVIAHLLIKKDKLFEINTKKRCVNINYSEIVYVENVARRMWVTLKNGKVYQSVGIRDSFEKQVGCLLQEENFIQPHKSYVANLDYVSSYTTSILHMDNDSDIPISRRNSLEVKQRYLKYLTLR